MAAALLTRGETVISNMPRVADLDVMIELFETLGAPVTWTGPETLTIDASGELNPEAPYELVTRMRASINVLGPLLARCGEARVAMPGGDDIGSRPLDMHFRGLEAMGAKLTIRHGYIEASAPELHGTHAVLEFPSVGATEQLLTASVLAEGETVIENAAREPELTDLATMLTRMGADIIGAGTPTIRIRGVRELTPVDTRIMGDRIEAGTFLMACAIAGGEITLEGIRVQDLGVLVMKLGEMGLRVSPVPNGIWARADAKLRATDVSTLPFPGFATDFMPMAVAMLSVADGTSIVTENVYENRYGFVGELMRMGANITHEGRHVVVRGAARLSGAPVRALDVRAGAALVLAGLAAEGETEVHEVHHIYRGYSDLPGSLRSLGADVTYFAE
jgi:UDP-N-acetylglucosamine 1-carboxyvinyltransferase